MRLYALVADQICRALLNKQQSIDSRAGHATFVHAAITIIFKNFNKIHMLAIFRGHGTVLAQWVVSH